MFRMIGLKPPHGWNAVAWELGIVTLWVFESRTEVHLQLLEGFAI